MSCHGAGRWARTARYSGCSKKPWRGGFSRRRLGEAGHGVEPTPVDGEGAHAVEGRGLPIDGAGGRPGGAPGELVLADLVRGQRGGPRGAAEARGEMGDPAAGGALGPELPDLVVLEVGVAELAQGRPEGRRYAVAAPLRGGKPGVPVEPVRARSWSGVPLLCGGRGRATVGPPSLGGRDREAECAGATGSRGDRWGTLERVRADRRIGRMSTAAGDGRGPLNGPLAGHYRPIIPR